MAARDSLALDRFREKLDRELKSGLVSLLLLLVVDRTGPVHGYKVLQNIKEASGGGLAFKEGTVYPLLNNLEKMEFLRSEWVAGDAGPQRKYYRTTPLGRCALDQSLEDWYGLLGGVDRILKGLDAKKKAPGPARGDSP